MTETAFTSILRLADLRDLGIVPEDPFQFGDLGHAPCFVLAQPVTGGLPSPLRTVGLRQALGALDEATFMVAGRALQYSEWDRNHRHCGR